MKVRIFILCVVVAITAGMVGRVTAGIDPTPFREVINKLNAIAHSLDAADRKMSRTLEGVPEDGEVRAAVADVRTLAKSIVDLADAYPLPSRP